MIANGIQYVTDPMLEYDEGDLQELIRWSSFKRSSEEVQNLLTVADILL